MTDTDILDDLMDRREMMLGAVAFAASAAMPALPETEIGRARRIMFNWGYSRLRIHCDGGWRDASDEELIRFIGGRADFPS